MINLTRMLDIDGYPLKGKVMTWSEVRAACKRQSDYIITLFITNEISLVLTWLLVQTRITPNQVTAASILSGFGCAIAFSFGYFIVGSFLLFVSHILDCTDGNLARAKSAFSPIGKWLDMAGDRLSNAAVFIGVSIFFIRSEASELWVMLALGDAIFLSIYYYIVDIGLAMGLTKPVQSIGRMRFKGVNVKWGLLEPVIYGIIILAPFGYVKIQLLLVSAAAFGGIAYQLSKMFSHEKALD
jgi:phosphatidylglycerophosphate synthase